jgi:hypothetical protein
MILRRVKRTVTAFNQRKKSLEKDRAKQLDSIEKMYQHMEAKDAAIHEHAKKTSELNSSFSSKFWIIGALVAYFGYIAFKTLDVIYLILAAFVISMVMDYPITWLSKRI